LKVHGGADADEKESEKEAFEGFEIALQFMAVGAAGEDNASDECAECGRETDERHEAADGQDEEKGCGGEDFAQAGIGDIRKEEGEQPAAREDDAGYRGANGETLHRSTEVAG
jgi:hypothetical protein